LLTGDPVLSDDILAGIRPDFQGRGGIHADLGYMTSSGGGAHAGRRLHVPGPAHVSNIWRPRSDSWRETRLRAVGTFVTGRSR